MEDVFPESCPTELPEIPEEETGYEDSPSVEGQRPGSPVAGVAGGGGTEGEGPHCDSPIPALGGGGRHVNRRYHLRPVRRTGTNIEGNIKKVLHNVIKTKGPLRRQHLETIFEEPIKENGRMVLIGVKRAKRAITFSEFVSKAKQKKRIAKAKKVLDRINEARLNEVERQLYNINL